MRIPNLLVGLAGLAGVALSSPTPVEARGIGAVSERSDNTGLSPTGGPGETKLCYTDERCVTLSANNNCVFIPGEVGHMVRKIYQQAGSICRYFDRNCNSEPVVEVNSHSGFQYIELEGWVGNQIGYVKCQGQWGAGAAEKSSQLEARDLTPGNVRGCNPDNNCQYIQPALHCKQFPSGIAKNLASILQWKHSICKYYESTDCSSSLLTTAIAGDQDYSVDMSWRIGERIASAYCEVQSAATDAVPETIHHMSSIETGASSTALIARANDWTPVDGPGSKIESILTVCHDVNLGGKCFWLTHAQTCYNNPFNVDAIESFYLEEDWRCAFFSINDCSSASGAPRYVDSRDGPITVNDVDYWISSVTCMRSPFRGAELDTAPPPASASQLQARNETTYTNPGDATICDFSAFTACATIANALNTCQPVYTEYAAPSSLIQYRGAVCKWYESAACCRDDAAARFRLVDSRNETVAIGDTGESARMKSVECREGMW